MQIDNSMLDGIIRATPSHLAGSWSGSYIA